MIHYCDSSAVAKIYLEEAGSPFMRKIRRNIPGEDIFVNDIAGPEVLSAMYRRFRSGDLTSEMISEARKDFKRDFLEYFHRISPSNPIITLAMQLIEKYPLRGYDSVQLATAVHLQSLSCVPSMVRKFTLSAPTKCSTTLPRTKASPSSIPTNRNSLNPLSSLHSTLLLFAFCPSPYLAKIIFRVSSNFPTRRR